MILSHKIYGKIKGRLAYNGNATRDWVAKEANSSPTVMNKSIMSTTTVDSHKIVT